MASTSSASEAVKNPSINDIDEYTLAYIFQYLSLIERTKVERVCTRWKTTSREYCHLYSKRLTIGSDTGKFSDTKSYQENKSILEKILRYRCRHIEDVNFTFDCKYAFLRSVITLLSQWCPKLKRLDAQYMIVSSQSLASLIQGCPNLEELILGDNPTISEDQLSEFCSGAKHLKRFSITYQMYMTGKCLLKLTPGRLESLHIEDCISFHLTPEIAALLAPSLMKFSLIGEYKKFEQNLVNIAQLRNLRRLLIRICHRQLTKCLLNNIVQSCSLLEAVDLGKSCVGMQDYDITILMNLPNLKELTIMCKTSAGENVLMANSFEKIERLTLGCSTMMNAEAYRSLIDRLPALKYFSVCSCSLNRRTSWVVDSFWALGRNVIVEIYSHEFNDAYE